MDEIEAKVAAIADADLAAMFAGKTDADLGRQWNDAADVRDWLGCELVYAEQLRRAGKRTAVPA